MFHVVLALAIAYVAGAFTPAVGREIKSWFVKEAAVVKADVAKKL
jgi:hypothetical protein